MLQRALAYPYAAPDRSFLQLGARTLELPAGELDLAGRGPLLSYGANAAPAVLARKLATLPREPLPLVRAELRGFDAVYSAHVSPYGAVPATLRRSPGTAISLFVAFPTAEQLKLLAATEPNYELRELQGLSGELETGGPLERAAAFLSRHGSLRIATEPVALAAIEARGRRFDAVDEAEMLELVRSRLFPEMSLERLVTRSVEAAGIAPLPTFHPL